jgi:hypothetical protein
MTVPLVVTKISDYRFSGIGRYKSQCTTQATSPLGLVFGEKKDDEG